MNNKIPQKNDFNRGAEKDFFSGTAMVVPHKPNQAKTLNDTEPLLDTPTPSDLLPALALPHNSLPETESGVVGGFEKNSSLEKTGKPFENVSEGLIPLRTYKKDIAGVMLDKKTSLVRLVLEEQKERNRREREISPTSQKNLPLILFSVVFFFLTVGLIYYIYFRINPTDRTLENLHITPLFFVEQNKELSVSGKDSLAIKREVVNILQTNNLKVDAIEYVFFTETVSTQTPDGMVAQKTLIPSDRFFESLDIKTPPMLLRSLRPSYMFGIHSFNKNQPFLILKTDYYDNAFAGILGWENKLAENFLPLFNQKERVTELSQRSWDDTVIKNKDTRVLRNFDGSIALVYAFKDQHTLIITTNEDTLLEVSRRLDLAQEKRPE